LDNDGGIKRADSAAAAISPSRLPGGTLSLFVTAYSTGSKIPVDVDVIEASHGYRTQEKA